MTEIAKPIERPRWASDVSADVITPPTGKQDSGWVQEYPPLQFFNWLGKFTYQWLDYLEKHTDASLGGGGELVAIEIAAGVLLPVTGNHRIDTEGSGATDDLTNINISNLADGRILIIRSTSAARVITVKHAAGGSYPINLRNSSDIVLDDPRKALVLIRNGNQWNELFGFLGSDPAPYLSADLDVQAKKITTTTVNGDIVIDPNGTGALVALTAGKAFGKTGTRWGSSFVSDISATNWVRTAALDTESSGGTLAIGGTNASVINIGRTGATVALLGSITNVHTTNTFVTDKLITLNDGGLATSGDGAGIEIEEDGSATGYIKVATNRNKWSFKAPNDAAVVSIGAEATVVGDIGLVSSVFTFMSNGFSFKNSAGTVIGSATDAGAWTLGPASGFTGDHTVNGNVAITAPDEKGITLRNTSTATEYYTIGRDTTTGFLNIEGAQASPYSGFRFVAAGAVIALGDSAGAWTLGPASSTGNNLVVNGILAEFKAPTGGHNNTIKFTTAGTGSSEIRYKHTFGGWDFVQDGNIVSNMSALGAWTLGPTSGLTAAHTVNGWTSAAAGNFHTKFVGSTSGSLSLHIPGANQPYFAANYINSFVVGSSEGIGFVVNGNTSGGYINSGGYWAIGPGSPLFAVKKLTGTLDANATSKAVDHGLSGAKIKSIVGKIDAAGSNRASIPGIGTGSATCLLQIIWDDSNATLFSRNSSFTPTAFDTANNRDFVMYAIYEAS